MSEKSNKEESVSKDNIIIDKLLNKSIEAFLLAIEIYNKPSIKYRVEGFSFFICNAWELMLKARLISKEGNDSIYYKDNPERTISLENCIQKVFTNNKDPLRMNLEKIIDLRNTSTHFITEEYEMVYVPLFQACVFNFTEKMQTFHSIDLTEFVPNNFLTLAVSLNTFNAEEIRAKYPMEIADKLISMNNTLSPIIDENNNRFAIQVNHNYYITKNKDKATALVKIDNSAETNVKIIKEVKDINATHKYSCKKCCAEITKRLEKDGINVKFNSWMFDLFCKYYGLKADQKYCYTMKLYSQPQYCYSLQAIDFIVEEFKKDPENIIQNLKEKVKK